MKKKTIGGYSTSSELAKAVKNTVSIEVQQDGQAMCLSSIIILNKVQRSTVH